MAFEQKEGCFACFSKKSKAGAEYFNGTVTLNGKSYNVALFEKTTKNGDKYFSGIIDEQKSFSVTQPETPKKEEPKKQDAFSADFLDDDIPFNLSRINGDYK